MMSSSSPEPAVHNFSANECPVTSVTVLLSRAQVHRKVKLPLTAVKEAGLHSLCISGLSQHTETDDVRAKCHSACILEEVSASVGTITLQEEENKPEVQELLAKVEERALKLHEVQCEKRSLEERSKMISRYVGVMLDGGDSDNRASGPAEEVQKGGVGKVEELLQFHDDQLSKINGLIFERYIQCEKEEAELIILREKLRSMEMFALIPPVFQTEKIINYVQMARQTTKAGTTKFQGGAIRSAGTRSVTNVTIIVSILPEVLEAHKTKNEDFLLDLSYIVRRASWKPIYDWRMSTESNIVKASYFAKVEQATGEDWNDVELNLSTTDSQTGAAPPSLRTRELDFVRWVPAHANFKCRKAFDGGRAPAQMSAIPAVHASPQNAATSTFAIQKKWTIASGGKSHKVTIGQMELEAEWRHFAVPAVSSDVFLLGKTRNTSSFSFLPSDRVAVFLDDSYVARTSIHAVAPGETFSSFFGVDPSVRIESHCEKKLRKQGGMLQRAAKVDVTCETNVYNTKTDMAIRLAVVQAVPISRDDGIKVRVTEPVLDSCIVVDVTNDREALDEVQPDNGKSCILFNKGTNCLLWHKVVQGGEKYSVKFLYHVDHPAEKPVDFF